jgi:hypothetical protein
MNLDFLARVFELRTPQITNLCQSLQPGEEHFRPYGNINSVVWEVGHLTFVRNTIIKLLDPEAKLSQLPNEIGLFAPRTPHQEPDAYPPLPDTLAEFAARGERIIDLLGTVTDERLAAESRFRVPNQGPTVREQVYGFFLHEERHLGELIVLRNILEKNREELFG